MFHLDTPLAADRRAAVTDSKEVIYEGFRQAVGNAVPAASAGVMVHGEFGADLLPNASRNRWIPRVRDWTRSTSLLPMGSS